MHILIFTMLRSDRILTRVLYLAVAIRRRLIYIKLVFPVTGYSKKYPKLYLLLANKAQNIKYRMNNLFAYNDDILVYMYEEIQY